jgi:hypothetical protein
MTSDAEKVTTSCFTYEVTMVVQVLASSRDAADKQLEENGGYVSKRDVVLKDAVELYSGKPEKSE